MSDKYRIKINSGRVIGPFAKEQVGELYIKGHVNGEEPCQYFPGGDWQTIDDFPELSKLIVDIIREKVTLDDLEESTGNETIQKVIPKSNNSSSSPEGGGSPADDEGTQSPTSNKEKKDSGFEEFKYSKNDGPVVDYGELEEKYQNREDPPPSNSEAEKNSGEIEKTKIVSKNQYQKDSDIDKTVVVNPPPEDMPSLPNEEEEDNESKESGQSADDGGESPSQEEEKNDPSEKIDFSEKTEFADINSLMGDLQQETKEAETELEEANKTEEEEAKDKQNKKREKKRGSNKKKKQMRPIVALAFLVIIWVLLDEEPPNKTEPVQTKILFPVVRNIENPNKAREHYKKGVKRYKKGAYTDKVRASSQFRRSLTYKFKENPSLGYLILTYSELFPNAANKTKASRNLFRLMKIGQNKILDDSRVAVGTSIFYSNNGKHLTAVNTLENFLRVNKPTKRIFAEYLKVLIKSGNISQAGKVVEKIKNLKNKPEQMFIALSNFYKIDERFDKGRRVVLEGLDKFSQNVPLLLELSAYFLRAQEMKNFETALKKIEKVKAERSPVYYAKFLEYMGVLSAYKGNKEKAAKLFNTALKINESTELRSKLAALDLEGEKSISALVRESKVIQLLNKARRAVDLRKWEDAFVYAIEAADMLPSHIGAKILLSQIQIERGFFEEAIDTLTELKQDYPLNMKVQYYLGLAYIRSSKLKKAEQHIMRIDQRLHKNSKFNEILGRYYNAKNNVLQAVKWFNRTLKKDPLNDEIYYELAKIFLLNRKYDKAKENLSEAIYLDPRNVYYRSSYAKILFELEGAKTAIGYLRDVMEDHQNHPKLIGDIAIYYYKNGESEQFERYKKKLEDMNTQDPSFYEFMVQASQLEGNDEELLKYARKLIKVNPGDLETRMMLGEFFLGNNKMKEAEEMFNAVLDRLDTYPKVNYYLAKIEIKRGNIEKAKELAKKEINNNPENEYGHYILGEVNRRQKDYSSAVKNYEKSISYNPEYVEPLMSLALVKFQQNYLDEARELYLRAKRHEEDNPKIWKQLGRVYRESGQSGLAVEAFETYLKLKPGASDRGRIEGTINNLK